MGKFDKYQKGFALGISQLRACDKQAAEAELYEALGITSRPPFYDYRNGKTKIPIDKIEPVEKVFRKYGVTQIWGTV